MITGIHHVTAIASDPQRNLDFYVGLLGLRLVKVTINYDDPGTYHFYYGDGLGSPGTILTFFPWPGASRGRIGTGQMVTTNLSIPDGAAGWWRERLEKAGLAVETFGSGAPNETAIRFSDPDGLALVLTEEGEDARPGWDGGGVPRDYAVRGVESVALEVADADRSRALLTDVLGFRAADGERLAVGDGTPGTGVYVYGVGANANRGLSGAGTVHHVAFRVPDNDAEVAWREKLAAAGLGVTPQMDRQYFRSIYFREPGGVLYEIATDPPGFRADEPLESLGSRLCLPAWLEPQRAVIEEHLPLIRRPGIATVPAS